jgi:transcriptional regulator with XRE-family HTH domain
MHRLPMRILIATSQSTSYCESGTKLQDSNDELSPRFDGEAFFSALDAARSARGLTWKKVAEQAEVPASTLTRMSQGRKPDVDSLSALCVWSGIKADNFFTSGKRQKAETLAEVTALFRADPTLSKEGAIALEAIIKAAYEQIRKIRG